MDSANHIHQARVVLGGVAPIPWHLPKVEAFLSGKGLDRNTLYEAGRLAVQGATPLSRNAYKIPLTQVLVRRALAKAGGLPEVQT
jgi:xanthine dehydrogenase YagS FAD-binding subunit